MGAWGVLAFDNDDANDWAYGLKRVSDLSLVESTLARVIKAADYLEAPTASEGLAACEVRARLMGRPGYENGYTKDVDEWVKQHPLRPSAALLAQANSVIDRVLADKSELRELWDEGYANEWLQVVEDLRARIRA